MYQAWKEFLDKFNRERTIRYLCVFAWIVLIVFIIGGKPELKNKFFDNLINITNPDWPIVVLIIFFVSISIYREELRDFIKRAREFYGIKADSSSQNYKPIEGEGINITEPIKAQSSFFADETDKELMNNEFIKAFMLSIKTDLDSKYPHLLPEDKLNQMYFHYATERVNRISERVYNLIYGSQIRLLEVLKTGYLWKKDLETFYEAVKKMYPAHYEKWDLNAYLNLLISSNLIKPNITGTYTITDLGKLFLTWLDISGNTKEKHL